MPLKTDFGRTWLPRGLEQVWGTITIAAEAHRLEARLVGAMVLTESAGETWAVRYEQGYRYLFQPARVKPEGCSMASEINAQQCSWGLMQIMGGTARELGFRGWMPELCRPEIGLEYGAKYLAKQIKRFGSVEAGVAAYNMGSPKKGQDGQYLNQTEYVDPVMKRMKILVQEQLA